MRNRLILAIAALSLTAGLSAALADVTDRFVAVDRVGVAKENALSGTPMLEITGVREGTAAPVTQTYGTFSGTTNSDVKVLERCERFALLAQARPGRYVLEIVRTDTSGDNGYHIRFCRLARVD